MDKLNIIHALVLSAVLLSVPGYASTARREGIGEFFDDTVMGGKLRMAIFGE
jgi:hypothetical protein